jgi:hypothetical protein
MFLFARLFAAFTKTGLLFLISKLWQKNQANAASEILIGLNIGMILSSLDSGKIFYNSHFKKNKYKSYQEEYFLRLLIGLTLGCLCLFSVLKIKDFSPLILILSLLILINDRIFDEIQRFLISTRNFSKWSHLQLYRSALLLGLSPLLFINNNENTRLIVLCVMLLFSSLCISFLYLKDYVEKIKELSQNIIRKNKDIFKRVIQNLNPCFIGLLASSLTLPKNLLLILFAKENINNAHLLFSICALQSFYIFGIYIIKKRWRILQDQDGKIIINKEFLNTLLLTSSLIVLICLILGHFKFLSAQTLIYIPFIITIEFLLNLNGTIRDVLFYRNSPTNLFRIDLIVLSLSAFLIIFLQGRFLLGLSCIACVELLRLMLYKNELGK